MSGAGKSGGKGGRATVAMFSSFFTHMRSLPESAHEKRQREEAAKRDAAILQKQQQQQQLQSGSSSRPLLLPVVATSSSALPDAITPGGESLITTRALSVPRRMLTPADETMYDEEQQQQEEQRLVVTPRSGTSIDSEIVRINDAATPAAHNSNEAIPTSLVLNNRNGASQQRQQQQQQLQVIPRRQYVAAPYARPLFDEEENGDGMQDVDDDYDERLEHKYDSEEEEEEAREEDEQMLPSADDRTASPPHEHILPGSRRFSAPPPARELFTPVRGYHQTPSGSSLDPAASPSNSKSLTPIRFNRHTRRDTPQHEELKMDDDNGRRSEMSAIHSDVFMSVYRPRQTGVIGVAYYSLIEETLYSGEFSDFEAVQTLKYRYQPEIILTSTPHTDRLYIDLMANDMAVDQPFTVKTMKRSDFSMETAIQRLRLLQIEELLNTDDTRGSRGEDSMRDLSTNDHTLLLKSLIDFRQHNMVCAIGALILHLLHSGIFHQLELDRYTQSVLIKSIQPIEASDRMRVDLVTLESLSIFVQEPHPGANPRSKEGASVFRYMNQTKTSHGAQLLRKWMSEPTTDKRTIEDRQAHVQYFTEEQNLTLVQPLRSELTRMSDISRLLVRFRDRPPPMAHWISLVENLKRLIAIGDSIHTYATDLPLLKVIDEAMKGENILDLQEDIEKTLEIETVEGEALNELRVRPGVSTRLDEMREKYREMEELLGTETEDDIVEYRKSGVLPPELLSKSKYILIYFGQLGFLVQLPKESSAAVVSEPPEYEGFEYIFQTDSWFFYKNETTRRLDSDHGDIKANMIDMEKAIVRGVQKAIQKMAPQLKQLNGYIAELDCLLGLAVAATQYNLVRPVMTTQPVLHIRNGRHLLQDRANIGFIPNSTRLGPKSRRGRDTSSSDTTSTLDDLAGSIHLITGPNKSGKSVYLKQVGIITYLAHTGAFVPAEEATIGLCDAILTRIKGMDTTNTHFSSFTYEASQMAFMLRHCTSKSLCLIDEFGKGTANLDGISLLACTIRHLELKKADCPKTLIATHFHELYSMKLIDESEFVSFWKMNFEETDSTDATSSNGGTPSSSDHNGSHSSSGSSPICNGRHNRLHRTPMITCLYKLVPGVSSKSFGTTCAINAGVLHSVTSRAADVAIQLAERKSIKPLRSTARERKKQEDEDRFYRFLAFVVYQYDHSSASESVERSNNSSNSESDALSVQSRTLDALTSGTMTVGSIINRISSEKMREIKEQYQQAIAVQAANK